jgi:hydrogenase maturation protease
MAVDRVRSFPARYAEPFEVLDLMAGLDALVVVDAAEGRPVGEVEAWLLDEAVEAALPEKGLSHAMGLREALLLGKALGKLPGFVRVVTVGVCPSEIGDAPSPEIAEAAGRAALLAEDLLRGRL